MTDPMRQATSQQVDDATPDPPENVLVAPPVATMAGSVPSHTWTGAPVPVGYPALVDELRTLLDRVAVAAPSPEVVADVTAAVARVSAALDDEDVDEVDRLAGRLLTIPGRGSLTVPALHIDEVGERRLSGRVRFGAHFLGSNGVVHGGAIPLLFDDVLGRFAIAGGRTRSRTAYLRVDYRSVAPIDTELRVEAWFDLEEGRKRHLRGTLHDGDRLCAEATALFVALRPGAT